MDFLTWFRAWLTQHPLKPPGASAQSQYTAEVMRNVRALEEPAAAPRRLVRPVWRGWVALTAGLATVSAGLIAVLMLTPGSRLELAQVPPASGALIRLAESLSDEAWLDQTMQLLDELNEDTATENTDEDTSDDDWLKELDALEQDNHPAS